MTAATTSEHGGFIRGFAATELKPTFPLDTAAVRDGVINNLDHLCDCDGQMLVNVARVSAAWEYPIEAPTAAYGRMSTVPVFAVPLRIRNDGASQYIVVQMRCSISSAGTADFRLVMRPYNVAPRAVPPDPALGVSWAADASTTSTTGADLDFDPLFYSRELIGGVSGVGLSPVQEVGGIDGSGSLRAASVLVASLELWAKSSIKTALPRVHSVMVREFIGKAA